jgi:hypothetical protein
MFKNIFLSFVVIYIFGTCSAQLTIQNNVLSSSGNTFNTGTITVDFTLGEVFTTILDNGNGIIHTQGFHQPMSKKIVIQDPILMSVDEYTSQDVEIYPNPFQDKLIIEYPGKSILTIELYDNSGRLMHASQLSDIINTIDFSTIAVGNYQLVLYDLDEVFGRIPLIKSR